VVRLAWFLRAANRRIAKTMPKGFYGIYLLWLGVMCNIWKKEKRESSHSIYDKYATGSV
jgi:hypothetical protein